MATATPSPATAPPIPAPEPTDRLFRIPLELYNRMGELGLLGPRDRVVLLDGFLVRKLPKGPRHVVATRRTYNLLLARVPEGYHPRFEAPVELPRGPDGDSSPEPDVVVVRGSDVDHLERHPGPGDVLLLIQVADSSLSDDRKALRRYGWAGVPTVWIVNLRNRTVEVYTGPSGAVDDPGYAQKATRGVDVVLEFPPDGATVGDLRVSDLFA